MSGLRGRGLAVALSLIAVASLMLLVMMATGRLRVDSELYGIAVGLLLVMLLWFGIARR